MALTNEARQRAVKETPSADLITGLMGDLKASLEGDFDKESYDSANRALLEIESRLSIPEKDCNCLMGFCAGFFVGLFIDGLFVRLF